MLRKGFGWIEKRKSCVAGFEVSMFLKEQKENAEEESVEEPPTMELFKSIFADDDDDEDSSDAEESDEEDEKEEEKNDNFAQSTYLLTRIVVKALELFFILSCCLELDLPPHVSAAPPYQQPMTSSDPVSNGTSPPAYKGAPPTGNMC